MNGPETRSVVDCLGQVLTDTHNTKLTSAKCLPDWH